MYIPGHDGILYAVSKEGRVLWKYNASVEPIASGPAVDAKRGLICFGGWDCNLHCIRTEDGEVVWKFPTSLAFPSPVEIEKLQGSQARHVVIWPSEPEKSRSKEEEVDILDYGSFSGQYVDITKSDYLGMRKHGYIKKKEF